MIRRLLRILATGLSFAVFGVVGILFGLIIYPVLSIILAGRDKSAIFCRVISGLFRGFIHMMRALGLLTFEISGFAKIAPGSIVVANHPSLIDVVFLLGWLGDTGCIVKGALFRNVFTMGPVSSAGYINNESPDMATQATNSLNQGRSLLVFPEGTRSTPGEPLKLRRGAAHLAFGTGAALCPVTIAMDPLTLAKHQSWWSVPLSTPHYRIVAYGNWPMDRYANIASRGLQARKLTEDLTEHFTNAR